MPNVVEPPAGIAASQLRSPIVTAAPDWLSAAFQICVTVCDPGHEYPTVQPAVAAVPEFVTVKPSWNPRPYVNGDGTGYPAVPHTRSATSRTSRSLFS
jgi:hypothetical protein